MIPRDGLRRACMSAAWAVQRRRHRLFRTTTVGVRMMLVRDDQVLLVRHTYRSGWYMPGGGVNRGESIEAAARREAHEETGASTGAVELFGVFTNLGEGKTDHITVFLCRDFQVPAMQPNHEIAEWRFFPLDSLPNDVAPGSRRRLEEYRAGRRPTFGAW